ncbi:hypothetical protein HY061_00795 [Candidatus Azambacteria bacterium]|nr:hypothetical protein [Candidatus Azambacteria bacterium]
MTIKKATLTSNNIKLASPFSYSLATLGNFITYNLTLPDKIKNDPFGGLVFNKYKVYIPNDSGLGVYKKY